MTWSTSTRITGAAGMLAALVLTGGCAIPAADRQAKKLLMNKIGSTSFTVFPAFVRAEEVSYDDGAAAAISEFLSNDGLGTVVVSAEHVPVTGPWHSNQAKMLRESAAEFAAYLRENRVETEYAVLPEYLFLGGGGVGGIHCYIVDGEYRLAFVVLLNSHWGVFAAADPETIDDCTAVLIEVLRDELVPKQAAD